jgi:chromatin modification-related protein VID21
LPELFEFKVKTSSKGDGPQAKDARPRNDQYWSANDDVLLKGLIDRYPGNWNLIAECFNGARLTTPSDRRTAMDCQDRWRAKWGVDLQAKTASSQDIPGDEAQGSGSAADGNLTQPATNEPGSTANGTASTSASTTSISTTMTTRGVKRNASASVSSQQAPTIAPVGAGSEPKKRRRHLLIQETIRRTAKKRQEQAQKMLGTYAIKLK